MNLLETFFQLDPMLIMGIIVLLDLIITLFFSYLFLKIINKNKKGK
jgi:hypothetical protein